MTIGRWLWRLPRGRCRTRIPLLHSSRVYYGSNIPTKSDHDDGWSETPSDLTMNRLKLASTTLKPEATKETPLVQPTIDTPLPISPSSLVPFEPSSFRKEPLNFDTSKMVALLQKEGFSPSQAESIMYLISEVVEETTLSLTKSLATKQSDLEASSRLTTSLNTLQNDITHLEKHDSSLLKNELDRMLLEVTKMKDVLREELARVNGSCKLDMNLEKARAKDEVQVLFRMVEKAQAKVDREIEGLVQRMETIRMDMEKTISPQLVGAAFALFMVYKLYIWREHQ